MSGDDLDDERLDASQWFWYSELLEQSGLLDVEPHSGQARLDDGNLSFSVRSASRGRITLGTIGTAEIRAVAVSLDADQLAAYREHVRGAKALGFEIIRQYAEELEAKRRKPLEAIAARKDTRRARTLDLHAQHRSNSYIARELKISRKTVGRYLAESENGTNHEMPS
jgi:hypothetical protein